MTLRPDGKYHTRFDLWTGKKAVSRLWVSRWLIRFPKNSVRMAGIGGVHTPPLLRHRGYATRLMKIAMGWMKEKKFQVSMLFGIRRFYKKFGYQTSVPGSRFFLPVEKFVPTPLGYSVRPFQKKELGALQKIYALNNQGRVLSLVRDKGYWDWRFKQDGRLKGIPDNVRDVLVVRNRKGFIEGYVRLGSRHWIVKKEMKNYPDCLVVPEIECLEGRAALSLISELKRRAQALKKKSLLFIAPSHSLVYPLLRMISSEYQFFLPKDGGGMIRNLSLSEKKYRSFLKHDMRKTWFHPLDRF